MYKIERKEKVGEGVYHIKVRAPLIAKKAKPGQFLIIRVDERGERIPLTIADIDGELIDIIFAEVGTTTRKLALLEEGEFILDVVGPLGNPSEIERFGVIVGVGGGVGIAALYPIAKALKGAGNRLISIIGARTKGLLFWEERFREISDELIVTTDDGSYGRKGVVTEPLKEVLEREKVDRVIAVGPTVMMKFCALTTKPYGVKTIVSLNPIMVDGTGMCGCCRVEVGGETKFTCVHGPEFDGHLVNWDLLMARQRIYLDEERLSFEKLKEEGWRRG